MIIDRLTDPMQTESIKLEFVLLNYEHDNWIPLRFADIDLPPETLEPKVTLG